MWQSYKKSHEKARSKAEKNDAEVKVWTNVHRFCTFWGLSVNLFMIENCSFLFVTFACGIEHETVDTIDACVLILIHLPVVDFLEKAGEVT